MPDDHYPAGHSAHQSGDVLLLAETRELPLQFPGHKDGIISSRWVQELARKKLCPAVVEAGIHYDRISDEGIQKVIALSEKMLFLNTISLESNRKIKINFNGGDLSSDGGLLLIKEFAAKIGLIKLVKQLFKTNDHTNCRTHTDPDNLMQMVYQIIAAYFEDDCADELTHSLLRNSQ